jgi:predicted nuclease of predicted toxin-antitoxin system
MPVSPRTVVHLTAAGHDAVHAQSVGLATATAQGRIVVTADLDYPRLLALQGADSPGVILFRGGSYSDQEMLGLLDRILGHGGALDLERSITVVDRGRIRSRRLPVTE